MNIYIFIFIVGYLLSIISITKNVDSIIKISVYFFVMIMFILSGLRSINIGYDNIGHELIFNNVSNGIVSFFSFKDSGYALLNLIVSFIGGYKLFIIVVSLVMMYFLMNTIKIFSINPIISIYMYYSLYFLGNNMAKIRQGLAVLIAINSLKYLYNNRNIKFIIGVLVATTFHASSIIFITLIFFTKLNLSKIKMSVMLLMALIIGISGLTESIFIKFIEFGYGLNIFGFSRIYSYVNTSYLLRDGGYLGLTYILINGIIIIIFYDKLKEFKTNKPLILAKTTFLGTIMSVILFNLPLLNQRISMFFLIAQIFLIPYIIYSIKNKYYRLIFITIYLLAVFAMGYNQLIVNYNNYIPFEFFWQS